MNEDRADVLDIARLELRFGEAIEAEERRAVAM